jgi:hypothetical protein
LHQCVIQICKSVKQSKLILLQAETKGLFAIQNIEIPDLPSVYSTVYTTTLSHSIRLSYCLPRKLCPGPVCWGGKRTPTPRARAVRQPREIRRNWRKKIDPRRCSGSMKCVRDRKECVGFWWFRSAPNLTEGRFS